MKEKLIRIKRSRMNSWERDLFDIIYETKIYNNGNYRYWKKDGVMILKYNKSKKTFYYSNRHVHRIIWDKYQSDIRLNVWNFIWGYCGKYFDLDIKMSKIFYER